MVAYQSQSECTVILDSLTQEPASYTSFTSSPVSDSGSSEVSSTSSSFYSEASSATSYGPSPCIGAFADEKLDSAKTSHASTSVICPPPAPELELAPFPSGSSDDSWSETSLDPSLLALSPLGTDSSRWNSCIKDKLPAPCTERQPAAVQALVSAHGAESRQRSQSTSLACPEQPVQSRHPRRTSVSECRPKPCLVRQSERRSDFVTHLIVCATQLVAYIWPNSNAHVSASPCANPVISLPFFIRETLRRSKTSYNTLLVALYYLAVAKSCGKLNPSGSQQQTYGCPLSRALQCGRRMFLASLILASKYLQDRNFSARAWSKISSLPVREINLNERALLDAIQWKLHVKCDNFARWNSIILKCVEDTRNTRLCPWQMIIERVPRSETSTLASSNGSSDVSVDEDANNLPLRVKSAGLKLDIPAAPTLGLDLTTPPMSADTPAASICASFPGSCQLNPSKASADPWKAPQRAYSSASATSMGQQYADRLPFGANVFPPSPALTAASLASSSSSSSRIQSVECTPASSIESLVKEPVRPVTAVRIPVDDEVDCSVRRSMCRRKRRDPGCAKALKAAAPCPPASLAQGGFPSAATAARSGLLANICPKNYRQMAFCSMNEAMPGVEQHPTFASACGELKRRGSLGLKRCGANKIPRAS